jgi:magnesium-transporting ATPase (P-type)
MNWKKPILATIGYTVITFAIAIIWHIFLFEKLYLSWGYFGENPGFLLGFLSILIQGIILSFAYQFLTLSKWKFVSIAGLYHWTVHVLAFMAKAEVARNIGFFGMETFYLIIQFWLYGLIIGLIWRKK